MRSGAISAGAQPPGTAAHETGSPSAGDGPGPGALAGASPPAPKPTASIAAILRGRDFRLLWSGEFVSLLGDQFFLVALPWLILQLTGDALTIGGIVAVGAAPRAIFMLFGGVLSDRLLPRTVMLYSNLGRMAVVAVMALLTATGWIQLWMLYAFSLLLGLGYAFYLPAQSTMIPRLVPRGPPAGRQRHHPGDGSTVAFPGTGGGRPSDLLHRPRAGPGRRASPERSGWASSSLSPRRVSSSRPSRSFSSGLLRKAPARAGMPAGRRVPRAG